MSNIIKIVLTFFILLAVYIATVAWVLDGVKLNPGYKIIILILGLEVPVITALIANWRNWDDKI